MRTRTSVDPHTGDVVGEYPSHTASDVEARIRSSVAASRDWARTSVADRCVVLSNLADELHRRRAELAELMTREMGKRTSEALAEVDKCIWVCRHYATRASSVLTSTVVELGPGTASIEHAPLGPILAVMPWNYPLWQVFRVLAPNLAAGNTLLLKHAPNVMGCAWAIEDLVRAASSTAGLVHVLDVDVDEVAAVVSDDRVRGVTLTGSNRAGAAVGAAAGRSVKKCVLELGGSDAFLVLDDADVEAAAVVAARSRLLNCGQTCISAKRFIAHERIHDDFVEAFAVVLRDVRVGDPKDPAVDLGPMARLDLREELLAQVRASTSAGANVVLDGGAMAGPGVHVRPILLVDVEDGHAVARQETFGPVAAVLRAASDDEAVARANASPYGLGATVFTADADRARRVASGLEVGAVAINDMVRSDPRLPFGGVKASGHGRELGDHGLLEFTNTRAIVTTGDATTRERAA